MRELSQLNLSVEFVQNRRFVMLSKPGEAKIAATKIMGFLLSKWCR